MNTVGLVVLTLIGLICHPSQTVDRSKFKTCQQSGFCRRARAVEPGQTPFYVDLTTVTVSSTLVEAVIVNEKVRKELKTQ